MITYEGDYRPDDTLRDFWTTRVEQGGSQRDVNDTCPLRKTDHGDEYYMRVVPYGANSRVIDTVVEDCDLLVSIYTSTPLSVNLPNIPLGFLKQRGSHAEVGYLNPEDGNLAYHVALWGSEPTDQLFHQGNTKDHVINIYRIDLSALGIPPEREKRLKREIVRWKEIFNQHQFPDGNSMNFDPVDYTSVSELARIARQLISRPPSKIPDIPKVNCVQWSCQTVSLALNFPLTRRIVESLGVAESFEKYWAEKLGYADDDLEGINCLPIPFYTPAQLVQKGFDMYAPGTRFLDVIRKVPADLIIGALGNQFQNWGVQLPGHILSDYLALTVEHGSLDVPLTLPGQTLPYMTVMPSTLILEERAHQASRLANVPVVKYVATAIPEGRVTPST